MQVAACTSLTDATACDRGYTLTTGGTRNHPTTSCIKIPPPPVTPSPSSRDAITPYYGCIPSATDNSVTSDVVSSSPPSSASAAVAACYEFVGAAAGANGFSRYCFFNGGGVYLTDGLGTVGRVTARGDANCDTRCGREFCGGTRGGGIFYSVYGLVRTEA